jgi:hypothetical protein
MYDPLTVAHLFQRFFFNKARLQKKNPLMSPQEITLPLLSGFRHSSEEKRRPLKYFFNLGKS